MRSLWGWERLQDECKARDKRDEGTECERLQREDVKRQRKRGECECRKREKYTPSKKDIHTREWEQGDEGGKERKAIQEAGSCTKTLPRDGALVYTNAVAFVSFAHCVSESGLETHKTNSYRNSEACTFSTINYHNSKRKYFHDKQLSAPHAKFL